MSTKLVILVNLGSPDDLTKEAIQRFLENMLSDPHLLKFPFLLKPFQKLFAARIAKKRSSDALELYKKLKGSNILQKITNLQTKKLSQKLNCTVVSVMRHSEPSINLLPSIIEKENITSCTVIPLFPQYSTTTTKSSYEQLESFFKNYPEIAVEYIRDYHDHPLFIQAWTENIQRSLAHLHIQTSTVLVFSAHSLPESYLKQGDQVYVDQLQISVKKIMANFSQQYKSVLSFQSKFGKGKWLDPTTEDILESLAPGTQVLLIPISFVSEHLETRYEMDMLFRKIAENRGLIFRRVPALNCSESFIDCLASCAKKSLMIGNQ